MQKSRNEECSSERRQIPLHPFVQSSIEYSKYDCRLGIRFRVIGFLIGLVLVFEICREAGIHFDPSSLVHWILGVIVLAGTTSLCIYIIRKRLAKLAEDISQHIQNNEADWHCSKRLQDLFQELSADRMTMSGVEEDDSHSAIKIWRPFRVEHFLSNSIRGEIRGEIFLQIGLRFDGTMNGIAVPNLRDDSMLLFLEDGNGNPLRVLLPSPAVVRSMFEKFIETYLRESYKKGGYTTEVLEKFKLGNVSLRQISHPQVVDALDASCRRLAFLERPTVQVKGVLVQNGVVLATALVVNGLEHVFLPTTFFLRLTKEFAEVMGPTAVSVSPMQALNHA